MRNRLDTCFQSDLSYLVFKWMVEKPKSVFSCEPNPEDLSIAREHIALALKVKKISKENLISVKKSIRKKWIKLSETCGFSVFVSTWIQETFNSSHFVKNCNSSENRSQPAAKSFPSFSLLLSSLFRENFIWRLTWDLCIYKRLSVNISLLTLVVESTSTSTRW